MISLSSRLNPVFFWPNLCPLRFSWATVRASLFCGAFLSPRFKRRRWWLGMPSNTTQQSTLRSSERQSRKRYHIRWATISIPIPLFWICWGSIFLEVVNTKLRGFCWYYIFGNILHQLQTFRGPWQLTSMTVHGERGTMSTEFCNGSTWTTSGQSTAGSIRSKVGLRFLVTFYSILQHESQFSPYCEL